MFVHISVNIIFKVICLLLNISKIKKVILAATVLSFVRGALVADISLAEV